MTAPPPSASPAILGGVGRAGAAHRPEWGRLPLGPYVFPRPAYDEALAAPVPLTEDPLAPLLGEGQP
ncbi:hypothetical protein OG288_27475 [Streptomyces tauricus]|uniref:Uncharacterized protein n=1 Tax=Streptomyces tauricus TaxID=68274 RepID=A0ABZ1JMX0_9ACTN|nr:hypothetical protein [Streptomyces tauricus]